MLDAVVSVAAFIAGLIIIVGTVASAIRTFVLARSARDPIVSMVFRSMRWLFNLRLKRLKTYEERDGIMAIFAPVSLIFLPITWITFLIIGYMLVYWSLGVRPLSEAYILSGSSLLTLGFASRHDNLIVTTFEFTEAALGLIIVAVLISYLPTMYAGFSRRESAVTMLEVRAGSPPSALEMIIRIHQIRGLDYLEEMWVAWEVWFSELEESHTSLAALVFFRSTKPQRSWLTAAGTVLDAASIYVSTLDRPASPQAQLCIRAGFIALRYIGDYFRLEHPKDPHYPQDHISISREEFDDVYDQLAAAGVPVKPDRDQCWLDFAGWRVNYDMVLLRLAALTMAPYAQWSSDRSLPEMSAKRRKFWSKPD